MNDSSSEQPPDSTFLLGAIGYLILGLVVSLSNLCIALSIFKYSALRQRNQYILLAALSLGDALNMLGYAAAGGYRLLVYMRGELGVLITAVQCAAKPHSILWFISFEFSALMLVVISCDRFCLIAWPETYLLSLPSPGYAFSIIGVTFLFTTCMACMGVIALFATTDIADQSPLCVHPSYLASDSVWSRIYIDYNTVGSTWFAFASVVVFALILPVYKWKQNSANIPADQRANFKSERKMVRSLAISCFCTFTLYCIPYRLAFMFYDMGMAQLSWCFWLVSMTNPLANLGIYQFRHWEMRMALTGLLTCKIMPDNLILWRTSRTRNHSQRNSMKTAPSGHLAKPSVKVVSNLKPIIKNVAPKEKIELVPVG